MERTFLSPPAKRPVPDPNLPNGSSKRSKSTKPPQPPISIPPGHVAFRILCQASRIGGVIGKSGLVIKSLQHSTGAKIRIEDAPKESHDRLIQVVGDAAVATKVLLSGGEAVEVSGAQEALVKVFDRILEVAAETEGIEVGNRVVCCRLVADAGQVGSVIGKGGKIVDKIRKDTSCRIRAFVDNSVPSTSSSDEVIEIEGNVSSVKKALVAVSRCLQDCPPPDRTKTTGSKSYEAVQNETSDAVLHETIAAFPHKTFTAVPHETLTDLHVDRLQRSSALSTFSSSSNSYAAGVHSLSADNNIVSSLEPKALQLEVSFKIVCSNDRIGGVIGKGGNIVKALQNETGASINIGSSVAECEDRVITITALESSESKYSPAQKAAVLVYTRSVEAGIAKGLDSGLGKRSSVAARLVVPSSQVGCLLGKGGVIVSEIRKATGASIRIIGTDQVPKCVTDNDQVVQITGEFTSVQDALYNATGRLRDNLIVSTRNSAGTRSLSSARADTSPYGRPRDTVSLGGQPALGVSQSLGRHSLSHSIDHHDLSRHTLSQSIDHHDLSRHSLSQSIDHRDLSRHSFPQSIDHHDLSRHSLPQSIDHHDLIRQGLPQSNDHRDLSRHSFPQSIDNHDLSRHSLVQSIDHHDLNRQSLRQSIDHHDLNRSFPQSIDHHDLSRHSFPQSIDHRDLSRHSFLQSIDHRDLSRHSLPQSIDHHELSRHSLPQSIDYHDLSRHTFSQGIDHHALARNVDRPTSPGLWAPLTVAGINSRGINDVSWGSTSRKGGLELVSGSKSAIVTNTTVEIVVPDNTIDCVYGENGSNLARLREISGAKVVVHEPRPGTSDRTIVISGTPDETQAAQSLLQSFIISGSS